MLKRETNLSSYSDPLVHDIFMNSHNTKHKDKQATEQGIWKYIGYVIRYFNSIE